MHSRIDSSFKSFLSKNAKNHSFQVLKCKYFFVFHDLKLYIFESLTVSQNKKFEYVDIGFGKYVLTSYVTNID